MSTGTAGVELPALRIVALADLVLHEDADERRVTALARQLMADGMVKNPPIVAPLNGERYVVLDGANRTAALQQLGVPDVVVQVASYDHVSLSTWHHLVVGLEPARLRTEMAKIPGLDVEPSTLEAARRDVAARRSLAFLVDPDDGVFGLVANADATARATLLRSAVAVYKGSAHIHRVQADDLAALRPLFSEIAGLVAFPDYRPADILALAEADAKLPSGITRHVIPRRVLRLNLGLDMLWADTNRAEKNRWLAEWVRGKLQAGHVRYYQEPTFLFDE